jgi:hypothetical protein
MLSGQDTLEICFFLKMKIDRFGAFQYKASQAKFVSLKCRQYQRGTETGGCSFQERFNSLIPANLYNITTNIRDE